MQEKHHDALLEGQVYAMMLNRIQMLSKIINFASIAMGTFLHSVVVVVLLANKDCSLSRYSKIP